MALWALQINRSTNVYAFNDLLSCRNVAFRFLAAIGCICLLQSLLSVHSIHIVSKLYQYGLSSYRAIKFIPFVCAWKSSSGSEIFSEFLRPLLPLLLLALFLRNNTTTFCLHCCCTLFSLACSSQGASTGLVHEGHTLPISSHKKRKKKKDRKEKRRLPRDDQPSQCYMSE